MEQLTWTINNHTLTYIDESHTYYVDGVRVPSITQLMKVKFPAKYDGIDPEVLKRAAERGTIIHSMIEVYEKYGVENTNSEYADQLEHYKELKELQKFESIENEIPIILKYNGFVCAGRLDMVIKEFDDLGLADIKTTYSLDIPYLTYQLNLYKLGYEQSYNKKIEFLKAIHLKKDVKKYVNIKVDEKLAYNLLDEVLKFQF